MYALDLESVERFWADLRTAMLAAGVVGVPEVLSHPEDLVAHWLDPALLLSQTCGLPYATILKHTVRYVCTPCFRVAGCEGGFYRSAIMIRDDEVAQTVADFENRRVAYNSVDSHSGYNGLRAMVSRHARQGRFFSTAVETTSHRRSLAVLRNREADLAAVDAVTLALVTRTAPDEVAGLRVLGYTDMAPGLPLITSLATDDDQLRRLRDSCAQACSPTRSAARDMLLDGIEILDDSAYDAISAMQARAEDRGYPKLA